jgi:hypothetical protein
MANITTYLENKLLEHSTGKTTFAKPSATYAALFTVSPTTSFTSVIPTGTEVTGTGYGRQLVSWASASGGSISNNADLTWSASGTWSSGNSITSIGIFDSQLSTGSNNLLWFGPLSAPVTLNNGDSFTIPLGLLVITIS